MSIEVVMVKEFLSIEPRDVLFCIDRKLISIS